MSSVSVPVIDDDIVEGDESFSVMLNIPPSVIKGIIAGVRNSATVIIADSTGKYIQDWLINAFVYALFLSGCKYNY